MHISQTGYKLFHDNQELYRLQYPHNLTPVERVYGLDRGGAFHCIIDGRIKGLSDAEIIANMDKEGYEAKARAKAWEMYDYWKNWFDSTGYTVILSEAEFSVSLQHGHTLEGRIDQLVKMRGGQLLLLENKTAWARFEASKAEKGWEDDIQVEVEILGAQALGYEPIGVLPVYTAETNPISVHPLSLLTRSPASLAAFKQYAAQTCDEIEMLVEKWGIETPWPHIKRPVVSPFVCGNGRCQFEGICQVDSRAWGDVSGEFCERHSREEETAA